MADIPFNLTALVFSFSGTELEMNKLQRFLYAKESDGSSTQHAFLKV
uniref:Uncharacterized protein n=1 Tax=Anguilla anguilla TaxID=7936 RepID=A0A0E9W7X1_ANGAN